MRFEPEYRERMKHEIGMAVPAAPGTPPGSLDPRNLNGIWVHGKVFSVDGSGPGRPGALLGGLPKYVPGGSSGKLREVAANACVPRGAPFAVGMPGLILQTDQTLYIVKNSLDGSSYRRIEMGGGHPANLVPTYGGHSIAHWEGDTLVVDTIGLKGSMALGMLGGAGGAFTAASRVTERIRKIEDNMTLEDLVTIEDPALAQPLRARLVSYYRPDLKLVEAPCEEYADPLETELSGPFAGGDEARGPPLDSPGAPPRQP